MAQAKHIVIRPNRSLSFRGMVWLFSAYLGLMAVIGLGFLGAGAWMVLPFAGVEVVLIFLINSQTHHEFPRYWAKLKLERNEHRWYPSRLMLGCYGRFVEIGSGLGEQDKQALAQKLKGMMVSPMHG
jgi:uncharacterized membrane protein